MQYKHLGRKFFARDPGSRRSASLRGRYTLRPLQRTFYNRDTHVVARELLGKLLVRRWRGNIFVGRITEVESYVGENDAACHASPRKGTAFSRGRRGRTPRTEVMYGPAGHAYVYLIYGMYDCLNIVTEQKDFPAAVLIRSLEPMKGMEAMMRERSTNKATNVTAGPGKLTRAFHITRALNAEDLTQSNRLFIANDFYRVKPGDIAVSPRVGVAYAGRDALLPWRYYLRNSEFISGG